MVLLPPTTLVTEVIVRSIRAANLDARSEDRRIEGHFYLRIRVVLGELRGPPRLDNPVKRFELDGGAGHVVAPSGESATDNRVDDRLAGDGLCCSRCRGDLRRSVLTMPRRAFALATPVEDVVRLEGFEPPTLGSVDRCSNPLSYSRIGAG